MCALDIPRSVLEAILVEWQSVRGACRSSIAVVPIARARQAMAGTVSTSSRIIEECRGTLAYFQADDLCAVE
jgi:hypothetical protein